MVTSECSKMNNFAVASQDVPNTSKPSYLHEPAGLLAVYNISRIQLAHSLQMHRVLLKVSMLVGPGRFGLEQ